MKKVIFILIVFFVLSCCDVGFAEPNFPIQFASNFTDINEPNWPKIKSSKITVSVKALPRGMTLVMDGNEGFISWIPDLQQGDAAYRMYYTAEKKTVYDDNTVDIRQSRATNIIFVRDEPEKPFLETPARLVVSEGQELKFEIKIIDPDVLYPNVFDANFLDDPNFVIK